MSPGGPRTAVWSAEVTILRKRLGFVSDAAQEVVVAAGAGAAAASAGTRAG